MTTETAVQYMPAIEQYMALAEALHDQSDDCAANYVVPFSECAMREYDIEQAVAILVLAQKAGWLLTRDPGGTMPLRLSRYPDCQADRWCYRINGHDGSHGYQIDEYMCPNCVTPWKCNGPHTAESPA